VEGAAIAFAARAVLAGVLLVAAVTKLRHRAATRAQTVALVGARSGRAIATVLPFIEIVIAVALVVWPSAVPGVVAAALLLAFTGVLFRAQARRLPCPCFGGAGGISPVGPAAIIRNAVLVAYAVLATGSPSGAKAGGALAAIAILGAIAVAAVWAAR
jgi:hypothetical protein